MDMADSLDIRARTHELGERLVREQHIGLDRLRKFREKTHLCGALNKSLSISLHITRNKANPSRRRIKAPLVSIFLLQGETSRKRFLPEPPCKEIPASSGLCRKLPWHHRKANFHTVVDHRSSAPH